MAKYTASSAASAAPLPPASKNHLSSMKPTFWSTSSNRDGISSGRRLASTEISATRAARFADLTDANVAAARTSVPPAVASDEMVTQSAIVPATLMEEIRAESWTHLHELLFADSWHEQLRRHRSDFVYRGEAFLDAKLATSLQRLGGDYATVERPLLRNFRKYAQSRDVPADSVWHWLALAKHHSL